MPQFDRCALVIVDVQKGFDDLSYWSTTGRRNDPSRARDAAGSPLEPDQDGNARTPELTGQPYFLVTKQAQLSLLRRNPTRTLTPGPRDDGLRQPRNPGEPPRLAPSSDAS
jgi:hypothetical protein